MKQDYPNISHEHHHDGENQDDSVRLMRRNLLKMTTVLGVGGYLSSAFSGAVGMPKQTQSSLVATADLPIIVQKRLLGSGSYSMEVSALGFGVMGMNHHRGSTPDRQAMIKLLHQVVDHGVTLFDTAEVYGPLINEELAGEGLYPYRNKVQISTKFGHRVVNGKHIAGEVDSRPDTIRRVAEESLKRLRIEAIDLFYQHRFDPNVPIEEVAGAVKDLITAGKVKHFGLCEVGSEVIRRAHAVQPVTAVQSEYHLMWREPENEVFPTLKELGIGFVAYSPINRGFLGGTINEYTKFDAPIDNRAILPRFTPAAIRENMHIVEALNEFGRSRGMTSAQIALSWLLAKESWIVPIPGTTKLAHLEENLRTAELIISAAEVQQLEQIISSISIVGDRYPASEQKQVGH